MFEGLKVYKMSDRFRIHRTLEMDVAHRVPDHRSKCYQLHGHRYKFIATLTGPLAPAGEQRGMVMDFGFIKQMMTEEIHDPIDHGMIIWRGDRALLNLIYHDMDTFGPIIQHEGLIPKKADDMRKVYIVNDVPTAENLAKHFYVKLALRLPDFVAPELIDQVVLERLRVFETPNAWADYPGDLDEGDAHG